MQQEKRQNLALRSSVNNALATASQPQSVIVTARMLDRAAAMTGHEMTDPESELWVELLSKEPPQAIKWAFDEHAKTAEFFPKPAEILRLITLWHARRREQREEEQRVADRQETERRRAAGETCGVADVITQFKQAIEKRSMQPMTPERRAEIEARIAKFREEKI